MAKQEKISAEKEQKRTSMFTVKDAENTMLWFCGYAVVIVLSVVAHQCFIKNYKFVCSIYFVIENISKIIAVSTAIIVFGEGFDIMLRRIREKLRDEKILLAKGEARSNKKWIKWDRRRREAETRGKEFTEPPPSNNSKK